VEHGERYESCPEEVKGDPEAPLRDVGIREKSHRVTEPVVGVSTAKN
jgi:hypothetical protein